MPRLTTAAWFRLLFAVSLLIPAGYFAVSAWDSRQRTLREADLHILTTVRLLREQTDKVMLADDLVLSQVDQLVRGMTWDEIRQSARLHEQLQALQARLPQVDGITLIDPDGHPAASNLWFPVPPLDSSDRDFFTFLRDHPDRQVFIGQTYVGHIRHQRYFNIAQRRTAPAGAPDGMFDGVIVVSVRPAYFSDFYSTFAGPDGLAIILLRTDGTVLARYPVEGSTDLPATSPLLAAARQADSGTYQYRSITYNDIRLCGFAHIHDTPLLVAYRLSRGDVLAPWRSDLIHYGVLTAIGSVALAMMTWLAMTNALQVARARVNLETVNDALAQEVTSRAQIEAELRELNSDLERRVAARTGSLAELASQRARESAFLASVLQAAPYAELVVDHRGNIIMMNTAAETLFGYARDELVGQSLERLVPVAFRHGHAELREYFLASPSARQMGPGRDLLALRKDGSEVPVEIALGPVETPDGQAVIADIVDISVRKQNEAALQRANDDLLGANQELIQANAVIKHKSEEVEAFVYIVSHDLRTPLINLQGFSHELELGCADLRQAVDTLSLPAETLQKLHAVIDEDIDGTLRYIRSSVVKFERLINALLELSRTGQFSLRSEKLDVGAIVGATVRTLGERIAAARAEVEVATLPPAFGDAAAVGQIFANLIHNAVKYAQPGRAPRIEIGGQAEPGLVHYWVRDNGVGIPASAQPRLFQVFQRFHPKLADGDGIGLASVRRLVERHGGTVWADSEPATGTTFHFTLSERT